MSASVTLPLNLADTGPILSASPTEYSFSPVSSKRSQPGMHFFRVSGSLSASQACCCVTPRRRLPSISMVDSLWSSWGNGPLPACAHQRREAGRQLFEGAEIVDREHRVCMAVQHGRTARKGSVALVAQQRVEPQHAARMPLEPQQFVLQRL